MKKLIVSFILLFVMVFAGAVFAQDTVSLKASWDANTEPDLAGYKFYYKVVSQAAPGIPYNGTTLKINGEVKASPVDVGNLTEIQISELPLGVYLYAVVTAYDNESPSLESGYSNEAVFYFNGYTGIPPGDPNNQGFSDFEWHRDNGEVLKFSIGPGGIVIIISN